MEQKYCGLEGMHIPHSTLGPDFTQTYCSGNGEVLWGFWCVLTEKTGYWASTEKMVIVCSNKELMEKWKIDGWEIREFPGAVDIAIAWPGVVK